MKMDVVIKYYKFTDTVTQSVAKDVGWVVTTEVRNNYKVWDKDKNDWNVLQDEDAKSIYTVCPREKDVVEISEKEYESLDTSDESQRIKRRRAFHTTQLEDLKERIS